MKFEVYLILLIICGSIVVAIEQIQPIQDVTDLARQVNDHTDQIAKSIEDGVKTYGNELLTTIRSMVIKASIYMIFFYFGVSLFVQMLVNFISIRQQKKILISMANDIIKIRRELEENKEFLKNNYNICN